MQTMDHHKEGTVVFYEKKQCGKGRFRLRHDKPYLGMICSDLQIIQKPGLIRSEHIIQITKNDSWKPELSAKVVTFFNDMLSRYAKGELTKVQVWQHKKWFMDNVMPLRRPNKRTLQKGIVATPAARDTVVSEATKSAASDTVDLANKRQKVPALVNVVATPVWTSHSERPCSATMIRLRSLTAGGRNLAEH